MEETNAVAKAVLGRWQISGVTRFLSGSPFNPGYSITGAGGVNLTGSTTEGAIVQWLSRWCWTPGVPTTSRNRSSSASRLGK